MKLRIVAAIAALACNTAAFGAPPTAESIETLLTVTKSERMLDTMSSNMDRSMTMGFKAALGNQPLTPQQQRIGDDLRAKLATIFREEMRWDRLEPMYVKIYQQTFTQEEVDGMIAFYRTPAGQALVDKMPLAMQTSLEAMQPIIADVSRRSSDAAREAIQETRNLQ